MGLEQKRMIALCVCIANLRGVSDVGGRKSACDRLFLSNSAGVGHPKTETRWHLPLFGRKDLCFLQFTLLFLQAVFRGVINYYILIARN